MTSFPAVGGYFGAVRVQRLKLWVLWSSQPCVRPQGAGACLLYWGSSTQRAVISVGCALFLRKHAAQLTCWQYVSAVVTTSRRLSSTSIGRRGRWHARVGTVHVIDRAEAGFEHLGGISFFQFPTTLLRVVWPHLFDKRQALVPDLMISGLPAHEALPCPISPITKLRLKSASKTILLRSAAFGSKPCFPIAVPYLHPRRC